MQEKSKLNRLLLVASACLSCCCSAKAQGTVNFANVGAGVNAPIYSMEPLTGYEVRLMAGMTPDNLAFVPPATTIKITITNNPTGTYAHYFTGGARVIPGIPGGTAAYFRVDVWSPEFGGSVIGRSTVIQVVPSTPPAVPSNLVGLSSFYAGCIGPYFFIQQQPASQTVAWGESATLFVVPIACPNVRDMQWFFNGEPIPGATNYQYSIPSIREQDSGSYYVFFTNQFWGARTSAPAMLTVRTDPVLKKSPLSQTAEVGGTARFQVSPAGKPPFTFQWRHEGQPITGATGSTLALANLKPADAGTYTVSVSNDSGSTNSPDAFLSLISPVERRLIPGFMVQGSAGGHVQLEAVDDMQSGAGWSALVEWVLPNAFEWWFDEPLLPQRFCRAGSTNATAPVNLSVHLVPELTLTGVSGSSIRLEGINRFGPTDAWFTITNVLLTNSTQIYRDTSVVGQPPRLWRIRTNP